MQDKFVLTASHGRIHYLHGGSGPALILLHSNGCSAYEYENVFPQWAEHHEVFSWDMPGHGDSDPLSRHYSIEDYCDALIEFMDAAGIRKADVLGSSVGGSICVEMGCRYAERVENLIIVETPTRSAEEWAADWDTVGKIFGVPTQTAEQLTPRIREVTPELLHRWNVDRNKAGAHTMFDVMWAIREYDVVGRLSEVGVRSQVIFGATGPVVAGKHNFETRLKGSEIKVMPDVGHFPMFDEPEAFADLVTQFTTREVSRKKA